MNSSNKSKIIIRILFGIILIGIILVVALEIKPYRIVGHSMAPTMTNSELVLGMKDKSLERGDIIAFETNEGIAIKRIIGLPGEKVFIKDNGIVEINGKALAEEYVEQGNLLKGDVETSNPCTLNEDEYYVLGDYRIDSKDSRYIKVGTVRKENIKSKIFFSISKAHSLK